MAICSDTVTSLYTGFCPQLNIYFHVMQLNRWLHLSCSLWEIPLRWDLFKRLIDQKIPFIATKKLNCISCLMVCKIRFYPEFPDMPERLNQKNSGNCNTFKAWFSQRQWHSSPWATKFDRLRFIAQSLSPEHSHCNCKHSVQSSSSCKKSCFLIQYWWY